MAISGDTLGVRDRWTPCMDHAQDRARRLTREKVQRHGQTEEELKEHLRQRDREARRPARELFTPLTQSVKFRTAHE